jgi:hypothetical protein
MSISKKCNILKLVAIFMLVGMMVGAFAMHAKSAFAAPTTACGGNISGELAGGTSNCDVAVNDIIIGVTGLSFTSDAAITPNGAGAFTFAATVTDLRNTNEGWQLQAASPGLTNNTVTHTGYYIPLTIGTTGSSAVCTPTGGNVAPTDCPDGTVAPITLTTTPATFVTETPDGTGNVNPISGTFALSIDGTYPTTVGTYPGTYTGAITLSLLNTF